MKRKTLLALLLFAFLGVSAQNISVKSFKALPMDMTASSLEGKRLDQNGDVAALIKVMTTETGFAFEGGTLGIVDTQQRVGEIWVWVPRSSRKITILHQQLGGLRDYRYPIEIEAERTYEMVLTTAKIETIVKEEVRMQYLAFQISPPNATLVVDEKYWDVEADGSAQDYVNFGTYSWRVEAPNYHSDAGRVTVDDPNNTKIVTVTLQPNFGWIEVAGTGKLQGASVYVDNALIGRAPCKSEALKSGNHTVRITKKMYATYTETVTVADNEITRLAPTLTADFAEVTLTVDADAEIYVNDERKGTRSWTGPLGSGTYKIECKQTNHETSTTSKEITAAMDGQTVTLPAPRPIYGALNVESTPNFCKLYIDGKDMGTTPKSIAEILIGQHEIKLAKDGYADYTETVTITKGDRKQVKATLSNGKEIQFTCNVPNAQLEIDGQKVGSATGTYHLTYGNHSLKVTATDYQDYTYTLNVSQSGSRSHSITMQAMRKDEETFTVNGVSFTMKLVEGGTFQMGATSEQGSEADSDEEPVHNVTLSSYYMGETEVTQALWKAVMGNNPSNFKGDNLPVEQVSWNDCQEFIRKLNQKTGKNFRLPTEAEWEYAARGGAKTSLYNGENIIIRGKNNSPNLDALAWYGGNCGRNYTRGEGCDVSNGYDISGWDEKQYSDSKGGTHPVKKKQPNAYGLYDMLGNVWEWCNDWYGSDYYGKSSSVNPQGPSSGSNRVLRGGSWNNRARNCRVSYRSYNPGNKRNNYGFRLALPE